MSNNRSIDPDRSGFSNFNAVLSTVEFIVGQFAKTIIVFCRYDFGERYFRIGLFGATIAFFLVFGFAWMFIVDGITRRPSVNPGDYINANSAPLGVFLLGFLLMSFVHQFAAWFRARGRLRWHSRYSGTSFIMQLAYHLWKLFNLESPNTDYPKLRELVTVYNFVMPDAGFMIKRYIEPLIFGFLGFIITFYLNAQLGFWLIFSSLCLATHEQLLAMRDRDRILDAIDSQIEGENLAGAISGEKTPQETEGFVLPVPKHFDYKQRKSLERGMMRLDPALAAILDSPDDQKKTTEPVEEPPTIFMSNTPNTVSQTPAESENPYLWKKQ